MAYKELKRTSWQRPFTAKRYLHPPFAENLITMWQDFRIVLGDIEEKGWGFYSSAFRLLTGSELEPPDFEKTRCYTRDDGVPVHSMSLDMDDYEISMESFCDIRRVPAVYSRITFYNKNAWRVSDEFAVAARTGDEDHLVTSMGVDGYARLSAEAGNWGYLANTFSFADDLLKDHRCEIKFKNSERFNPVWQGGAPGFPWHLRNILRFNFTLEPGEKLSMDIMFRRGETCGFNYDAEKRKAEEFWLGELAEIQSRPDADSKIIQNIVNSLVAQSLQMFCHPVGKDYVYPRQGGLQRVIWPVEAMEYLIALDRIGGFSDYTETAFELYFGLLQETTGEDAGIMRNFQGHQQWASNTGGALWALSRHLIFLNDNAVYKKYRDKALLAFKWIERQRSHNAEGAAKGIFPPMKSADWGGDYQNWGFTDSINLQAYKWLAKMLDHYGDPMSAEIKSAYDDYMAVMRGILRDELEKNTCPDEILLTDRVGVSAGDPPEGPYFNNIPMLMRANVIEPNTEASRLVENYFINRRMFKNGLTGLMNDGCSQWAGHMWYTSFSDMSWFIHWMRAGETEKARKTLEAQFKYGMTPEYYMPERYADNDPYFTPWLPNASANGRTIMMLFAFYNGEIDN